MYHYRGTNGWAPSQRKSGTAFTGICLRVFLAAPPCADRSLASFSFFANFSAVSRRRPAAQGVPCFQSCAERTCQVLHLRQTRFSPISRPFPRPARRRRASCVCVTTMHVSTKFCKCAYLRVQEHSELDSDAGMEVRQACVLFRPQPAPRSLTLRCFQPLPQPNTLSACRNSSFS